MTWFRVDDGFHSHPKILAAGNAATGLFVRFGSYCSDQGTDGVIPLQLAKVYGTAKELRILIDHGLIDPHPDGYIIPDFLDFNPSAEEVRAERAAKHEAKVAAGRVGGIASGIARRRHERSKPEANPKQNRSKPEANNEAEGQPKRKQNEAPSRPVPSRPSNSSSTHDSLSSSVSPPTTDDDRYQHVIELIVAAKERAWTGRINNPKSWRHRVHMNTHLEDGELIRRMLTDEADDDQIALFVLGHGASTTNDRAAVPWCDTTCGACAGEGWIGCENSQGERWCEPCPNRPEAM